MNVETVTQFISGVGFPVAMCVALFYYMIKQRTAHSEELNNLRDTLEENTKVLTELSTLIKVLTDEKKG